jgi:hypothetical protein
LTALPDRLDLKVEVGERVDFRDCRPERCLLELRKALQLVEGRASVVS